MALHTGADASSRPEPGAGASGTATGTQRSGPPDLDHLLQGFLRRVTVQLRSWRLLPEAPFSQCMAGLWMLGVFYGLWGLHVIKETDRGVVTRLGCMIRLEEPGLRWLAPGVEQLYRVDVGRVRELSSAGLMLTQDENVVKVELSVQYKVQDPHQYLFQVVDADESLRQALDSALRYVIGHTTMNDILTTGRSKLRQETWVQLDQILRIYQSGLAIQDVNFQSARAPDAVKEAFDDAISAQEDEQRFIREAEAYVRELEPRARGQVQRLFEEASAYREQAILQAQSEVTRCKQLLPMLAVDKELLQQRLYLESMEAVLSTVQKYFLDAEPGSVLVLPAGKPAQLQPPASQASEPSSGQQTMANLVRAYVRQGAQAPA